jgi:UPF0755 protein
MARNILIFVKWLLVLVLVLGAAFLVYAAVKISTPQATAAPEKIFSVPPGWTTSQVAGSLKSEGLISRVLFFKLYIHLINAGEKIQAGNYTLSASMSIEEITRRLVAGEVIENAVRFTVLEGWTEKDIAAALKEQGIMKGEEFLAAVNPPGSIEGALGAYEEFSFVGEISKGRGLEGFLFPDTYLVSKEADGREFVRKMLSNFDRKLTSESREEIKNQGKTLYQILTLASIIEKEVGRNVKKGEKLGAEDLEKLQQERQLVAGVFYNRLKMGKPLESDATVTYITGRKSNRATVEETKIDSLYNTYKYPGLPPGPISNPSLDSILAAIYPAKTDYLFFVTDPSGTAYFAKTLEEHKANRAKYLSE